MNIEKTGLLLRRIHFARLVGIVILVNVVILTLFVIPRRSAIASLQDNFGMLRQQAQTDQNEVRNLKVRLEALQRAQQDLKKIYSDILLTQEKGPLEIRLELEDLVRSMQIKKLDFSYGYQDYSDYRLQEFKLSVPVEGNYRNIRRFINSIERSKHFLILDKVDLSLETKAESLNLGFSISTYLVQDEDEQQK